MRAKGEGETGALHRPLDRLVEQPGVVIKRCAE
jgi:hypothetical protein